MTYDTCMKAKDRLDRMMVFRGLAPSGEKARALIMAGRVTVDGRKALKSGMAVPREAMITISGGEMSFVSRGGLKLEPALSFFGIDPSGKTVMDIGCSTGGFTDCVLKKGAGKVFAIDVGYGQIDWSLRHHPKIVLLEKTNIRHLSPEAIGESVDLVLIDVSFISLSKVLPKTLDFLGGGGEVIALIKPQFEVGKGLVEKGGVIRDEAKRLAAVSQVREGALDTGFEVLGLFESPVRGQKGNIEYFIHLRRHNDGRG